MLSFAIVPVSAVTVDAASYPLLFPESYTLSCEPGEEVQLNYTYYPQYKNEKIIVIIYDESGAEVSKSERSFYNTSTSPINYSVKWNTEDYLPGKYKAVATTKYYSLSSWNESPSSTTVNITINGVNTAMDGFTFDDARNIELGKTYNRSWTKNTDDKNFYNKFTLSKRGCVTIKVRNFEFADRNPYYDLTIYDANKKKVWDSNTYRLVEQGEEYSIVKVGLDKGTYYLNIKQSISIYSGIATTDYSVSFYGSDYYEIENNNTLAKATSISANKKYVGFIGLEDDEKDYYKIYLKSGVKYKFKLSNIEEVAPSTVIIDILKSTGADTGAGYELDDEGVDTFIPDKSGYYYVRFDNYSGIPIQYGLTVVDTKAKETSAKLSFTSTSYTGKVKTPSVTVTNGYGTKLTKDKDYTVTYADGRKNVGKYKVTVKFKGDYSGTKTLYFTINPEKTGITNIKSYVKRLKVYYSKRSRQTTGYQIQYSKSKSFKSAKTITVKSYKTTSVSLEKLSAKTTYYVRVRTYKIVDSKPYYSGWSSYKSAKTK